jgi:2-dehydro-3-deoxygluconokinase
MNTQKKKRYDLITLGEPLLRLSPPGFEQLRRTASLNIHIVGSQLNVAANLARLGKSTAFLTRLPSGPLGLLAKDACSSYGVDVSHIDFEEGGKMGVTYVEFSVAPRAPRAVYDRAGSSASKTTAKTFDWNELARETAFVYTDGIFPGLSESCREATAEFIGAAKRQGATTCFDVNYREHLWTPTKAKEAWSKILPEIDILVINRGVSEGIFGYTGTDEELMKKYAGDFGCKVVCLTSREILGLQRGGWNSMAYCEGKIHKGHKQEFDIADRYGTGDAWFAGFLYGYMEKDIDEGLNFGNAMCALAHTIVGDIVHVEPGDVKAIMNNHADLRVKR